MGGCCSVGDSTDDSAYRLAGGKARRLNNAEKPAASGSPAGPSNAAASTGQGVGSQRTSFVYPKMPTVPRRTPIDSPSGGRKSQECSETKINNLFDKYKDRTHQDVIVMEGIVKLCNDLGVSPEDFEVLVLAWNFEATQMGRFTKGEFVNGCKKLNADSVKQLQARLPELVRVLENPLVFKDFYRWAYQFALDSEVGQRILSLDMSVQLWPLVFAKRRPTVMPAWIKFLQKSSGNVHSARGISRDTWNMFLHFVDTVGSRFELYSAEEAWPSLIDDFVEHELQAQSDNWRVVAASSASSSGTCASAAAAPRGRGAGRSSNTNARLANEILEDVE